MWNSFTNYEMLLYTQWAPFYSLGKNSVLMFIWDFVVFEIKPVIKRHFLDSNFFSEETLGGILVPLDDISLNRFEFTSNWLHEK